ncbi:TPA: replication protein RepA [Klebsiella pneumoniae]|nr:replication protein RepA [Klebsiella pneumoniae]HBW3764977.1 replication protein RepA [Klebsiella pneumoniae]HCQ7701906.1 replication protein RepA [Klebsiella pneumoniae]HEJ0294875.1 replication protein RepA [Klebsiella pneumoniae]
MQGLVNQKNPYLQLSDIESVEGLSPEFISWLESQSPKESPQQLPLNEGAEPARKTRRRRGTHSTACLCPEPSWYRPDNFKKLPGQLGHAYNRLVRRDRKTGALSLRMRISRHPYFVQLREQAGRKRDFRPEREKLLDAIVPLLVSTVDRATHIDTINLSKMAWQLSEKDSEGNVIRKVTVPRVCRLLQHMMEFGLLALPEGVTWDPFNRKWFPKHVVLTERLWKMIGVDLDKLYAEQAEQVAAEAAGWITRDEHGQAEEISVKAARRRWYEKMMHATLVRRREAALKGKREKKLKALAEQPYDDRAYAMSVHLIRTLPKDELHALSPEQFTQRVRSHLYQLDLGLERESGPPDYH